VKLLRRTQVLIFAWLLVACGGTELVSVDDERREGAEVALEIEEQIGIYPAEFLTSYVDAVGRRLVANLDDTPYYFRFKIVDQAEPSAFAAPGGHIFLSRGILALINTEDELAGILAHEISHVTERHPVRRSRDSILPGLLTVPDRPLGQVIGGDVGEMINRPIDGAGQVYLASYGRGQESDADLAGMRLAARSGYDPAALGDILGNLGRTVTQLTGQERKFRFFDGHPTTPARIADIERFAGEMQWSPGTPFAKDAAALFKHLDGLIWGPNNPRQGVFDGQQFMQPDLNFSIVFPHGWQMANTPFFVGAFAPDNEALVLLGGVDRVGDPQALADAFIVKLREEAGLEPVEARAVEIGDWLAYLVRIEDVSGAEPVSTYYLWVNSGRSVFQIIAVGANRFTDRLRDTVLSLRNMTPDERRSIDAYRIRIIPAEDGESLTALSARTDNIWSPELTAAINGLQVTAELRKDVPIKILRREAYLNRP